MDNLAPLLTMYGGSGPKAGMTANDLFSNSGDLAADEYAMSVMRAAQSVDPNAKIGATGGIEFDRSKLPASSLLNSISKFDRGGGKGGNLWDSYALVDAAGTANGGASIKDPSKVIHDVNYGDFVAKSNLNVAPGDSTSGFMGALEKYMPAVISMVMAAGGAAAGIGGLVTPGMINSLSGKNPLESILGSLAGMTGVPGAGSIINLIMQQMQKHKGRGRHG